MQHSVVHCGNNLPLKAGWGCGWNKLWGGQSEFFLSWPRQEDDRDEIAYIGVDNYQFFISRKKSFVSG